MTEPVALRLAANLVAARDASRVPDPVMHAAERLILDTLGCALGAIDAAPTMAARAWAARSLGVPPATILGTGTHSSVTGAALANTCMTRHLDLNDCDWSSDPAHPSDNIAACLAVAEVEGSTPQDCLMAILTAYELQMRSTEFTAVSFFRTTGWDHTTFVTLATAAGTATLLKLDAGRMAHALAIAASFPVTGQLRVGQISMMKAASAGLAASRGIEAAYLAADGVTGPIDAFEGRRGLSALVLGECDWELFTGPVGQWRLPRSCIKQYPAAYIIHSSIDAALSLRRDHVFDPGDIADVEVAGFGWLIEDMVHGMGGRSRYDIDARETADHSLPYCVAAALAEGRYAIDQLEQRAWERPAVKSMLAKTRCVHDPSLDGGFPARRPARVTVALRSGTTYSASVEFPRGDPRNPMSDDDVATKFRSLSAGALTVDAQHQVIDIALNFRKHDVGTLLRSCCQRGGD